MLGKSICMYYLYKIKSGLNNEDTSCTVDLHIGQLNQSATGNT